MSSPPQGSSPAPADPRCSRRDCHASAVWMLVWNNPKVHTPERRKTWAACGEHREYLSEFLSRRGFLREVVAIEEYEG